MTRVSVIVPARNAAATISDTLEALAAQDVGQEYEVIVVDDGSDDETVRVAERAPGDVSVLTQDPQGPGAARNRGARQARGEVLAFTDADCVPTTTWLASGLSCLEHADLVQGRVLPVSGVTRRVFDHTIWITADNGLYETANLFVRRDLFLEAGGFEDWLDVSIGKRLGEDVWFGWKARRSGARAAFCREALVHHAVIPRGGREFIEDRRRLVYFPALVRRVPELRRRLLWGRVFLNRRTAGFDAALAALALAVLCAALVSVPVALACLVLAAPYVWLLVRRAVEMGARGPRIAAIEAVADAVGFGSLVWGSLRHRTPVL